MGALSKPRCSLCKKEALIAKIRTPAGRIVTAIFCPRCDQGGKR